MQTRAMTPNGAWGYWRGPGMAGGSGSGMGTKNQGLGVLPEGMTSAAGAWHPTVLYMLGLIVAEMVAFHIIGRLLK